MNVRDHLKKYIPLYLLLSCWDKIRANILVIKEIPLRLAVCGRKLKEFINYTFTKLLR